MRPVLWLVALVALALIARTWVRETETLGLLPVVVALGFTCEVAIR